MSEFVTTARIVCKSNEAREKVLAAFHKIVEFSKAEEPGVSRYIATVPLNDVSGTEIYMIEEYTSPEANASHMTASPVQELISLMGSGEVLASAPEVHNDNFVAQKKVKPSSPVPSDPAVVLSSEEYKPGTLPKVLENWKRVVEQVEKNEGGTKAYAVLANEGSNFVRTVEVYENWQYLDGVHLKSPAVRESHEKNGHYMTGVGEHVRLRVVHGFFGRGQSGSKM